MENPSGQTLVNDKVRIFCSHGGEIAPFFNNASQLTYYGGTNKLLIVDRNIKFVDLIETLSHSFSITEAFLVKYKVPGEEYDLDSLVSVIDDADVEKMMLDHEINFKAQTVHRVRMLLFGGEKKSEKSTVSSIDIVSEKKNTVSLNFTKSSDEEVVKKEDQSVAGAKSGGYDIFSHNLIPALDFAQICGSADNVEGQVSGGERGFHCIPEAVYTDAPGRVTAVRVYSPGNEENQDIDGDQ